MQDYTDLDMLVLNKIQVANALCPISSKTLCNDLNISFRILKQIITKLRNDFPIVSKETNGGGYWIATSDDEILAFTNMINARKCGYDETINKMLKFIK